MVKGFFDDLAAAKEAEKIVLDIFSSLTSTYDFQDVSNNRAFYHKGDIVARSAEGKEVFIEVKQDGCIARTGNVLCEEKVFY